MNSLKKLLEHYLEIEKIKSLPRSYDLIGHVAILEIPENLQKKKRLIAKAIMQTNKKIETVLEKKSERRGVMRLRRYRLLAGKKKTETLHREYGMIFKLDTTKVYFSPRELTERQRIAELVKRNEIVLVMFAGIGPFVIVIAKQSKAKKVIGIEINKNAVQYFRENVRINKVSDKVEIIEGDVREKSKKFFGKCDRVIMPLPLEAAGYLDIAVKCLKKNGIVHFYSIGEEENPFDEAVDLIENNLKNMKVKFKILNAKKVLPYSPRRWKICIDFLVRK